MTLSKILDVNFNIKPDTAVEDSEDSSVVEINYKSGKTIIFEVGHLTCKKTGSRLDAVEWQNVKEPKRRPLYVGVDSIESIWELDRD